jgi:hypothetical protein
VFPDKVYAIGIIRDTAAYQTPITTEDGLGFSPLSVLDADEERAVPVFTTQDKAERAIVRLMSEEERTNNPVGAALVDLDSLLRTMQEAPGDAPRVGYVGLDMGEGGIYPLIRL